MSKLTPLSSVDKPNPLIFDELHKSHIYVVHRKCLDFKQHIDLHALPIQELLVHPDVLSNNPLYKGVLYDPSFFGEPVYPTFFSRREDSYSICGFVSSFYLRRLELEEFCSKGLIQITQISEAGYLPIVGEVFSLQDLRLVASLVSYDFHLN